MLYRFTPHSDALMVQPAVVFGPVAEPMIVTVATVKGDEGHGWVTGGSLTGDQVTRGQVTGGRRLSGTGRNRPGRTIAETTAAGASSVHFDARHDRGRACRSRLRQRLPGQKDRL
ncbi:MAG: hypothetical protein WAV27_28475 [Xanthobacteraceae bacterium]